MKKIIELNTKEEIIFTKSDLPMMVHGIEHSGASLLSITIATILHRGGEKLCIFTAYPMAKDEFDKAIIISSDGDYYSLVKYLYDNNKLEMVLSPYIRTCSKLLKREAKERINYMDNLQGKISRNEKAPREDKT